ncbi:hypothetical protein NGM10_06700 [Halorussus salilacus]|uniref:hypothetical protein n=1 Tax=Halorussus salilacus TaxID=2953750 RepID=UPI00209FB61C|nr:hypothetical protein [Halorussus salilacus]USZ69418.1 hypothetical protein NGM10_06700 [Halorussus salilacus]
MSEKQNRGVSRRDALKKTSIAFAGSLTLPSVVRGEKGRSLDDMHRDLMQSRRIQNNAGLEARINYLEARGIGAGYNRLLAKFPNEGNGPSTADSPDNYCVEPDKCDGDIDLTLWFFYDQDMEAYYAELSMRYRYYYYQSYTAYDYWGPRYPDDGAGIMWEKDHWEVMNADDIPSSTEGDDHVEWDNGSWNQEGLGYRVNSADIARNTGQTNDRDKHWSDYEYAGVYLNQAEDYEDGDSIHAAYEYTWSSGELSGVSVSYPWGISVSASSTTKSEDLQTELDGSSLMVDTSDAYLQ